MSSKKNLLSKEDIRQIIARGATPEDVLRQIENIKRGVSPTRLLRPATTGDGVIAIEEGEIERLGNTYALASAEGRAQKFVPSSGAASRMFTPLLNLLEGFKAAPDQKEVTRREPETLSKLREGLGKFAFYDELREKMRSDGEALESAIEAGDWRLILDYLLNPRGLDYARLPKGLIRFHRYRGGSRSAFEEHLVEAICYVGDRDGIARIHFTLSPSVEDAVREHIECVRPLYERKGIRLDVSFSAQHPSTDTIAVDPENMPLRDSGGRLLFRPGGHGALLVNLNELRGDIVFIKNIDNVVPDRLKPPTYRYKRALGGWLIETQNQAFSFLKALAGRPTESGVVDEGLRFCREKLFVEPPRGVLEGAIEAKADYLKNVLNRPLRVCGVVKNVGEPGGGPFWVRGGDGAPSLQIVESAEVDLSDPSQLEAWRSGTHFNPVDIVCGVRDFEGRPFDLSRFRDPERFFISHKSSGGRELKALELPGLWNGGMAHWNTVFIEVPLITFNPVKTLFDLLREEHLPD